MVGVIILGVSAALLNDAFFNFLPPVTVAGAADALLTPFGPTDAARLLGVASGVTPKELFAGVTYDEWSPFTISLFTAVFFSFSAATFFAFFNGFPCDGRDAKPPLSIIINSCSFFTFVLYTLFFPFFPMPDAEPSPPLYIPSPPFASELLLVVVVLLLLLLFVSLFLLDL